MFRVEYDAIGLPRPLRDSRELPTGTQSPARTIVSGADQGTSTDIIRGLHELNQAAILLNPAGQVIGINGHGEAQIGRTIALRGGRLVATCQNGDMRLQRLIKNILRKTPSPETPDVTVLSNKGGQHFVVRGTRVTAVNTSMLSPGGGLLTIMDILTTPAAPRAAMLREFFGLTVCEASVAMAIANGEDARSIAFEKDIAIDTVRSHLKAIFAKTNTRRQVALAVLLARLQSALDRCD